MADALKSRTQLLLMREKSVRKIKLKAISRKQIICCIKITTAGREGNGA